MNQLSQNERGFSIYQKWEGASNFRWNYLATIAIPGDFTSVLAGEADRVPCLTFLNSAILVGEAALEFGDREQEVVFDYLLTAWNLSHVAYPENSKSCMNCSHSHSYEGKY
jgi:hypothetical protein